jgi:hypothetical protein
MRDEELTPQHVPGYPRMPESGKRMQRHQRTGEPIYSNTPAVSRPREMKDFPTEAHPLPAEPRPAASGVAPSSRTMYHHHRVGPVYSNNPRSK